MQKVLFYLDSMRPAGGIERVVATLTKKLAKYYKITILVKDQPESFYELSSEVVLDGLHLENKRDKNHKLIRGFQVVRNAVFTAGALKKYLKDKEGFDYYYVTTPVGLIEILSSGVNKNKIIISEHGAEDNYNSAYKLLKKLFYKKCHKYVVPTTHDSKSYQKKGFPVIHIPHFKPDMDYEKGRLNNKIVLNIGRFTADKQQLALIKIWHQLIVENTLPADWTLRVVGQGELKSELLAYVSENKLHSVQILEARSDINEEYKKASIFALTSRSEGFGMVLLEAISFGVPVIAYDCNAGPRDIVTSGYNGWLIPLNHHDEYKNKLLSLMTNFHELQCFGDNAYTSSSGWSDDKILNSWSNVFR